MRYEPFWCLSTTEIKMTEINDKKAEQMAALDIVQSAIDYFEHAFGPRKARTLKMIWGWVKKRSKPTG